MSGKIDNICTNHDFKLAFAGLRQPVDSMIALDLSRISHDDGLEVSGILGSATLSQLVMEIDYRDNLVHFTFDPSKGFH